jgi:integrase
LLFSGKTGKKLAMAGAVMEEKKVRWEKVARGVRVKIDPSRKHGKNFDRYFVIRYAVDGEMVTQGLGWASEGMTQEEAVSQRLAYIKNAKGLTQGPRTKAEKIQAEEQEKAEAERLKRLQEKELLTLADYWPEYLGTAKQKKKAKSWDKEESHFRNWLEPLLGHIPLRQIGLAQWDFLIKALTDAGLAPRTRQYIALTLRQVMDHAFMRKIITEAPPRGKHVGAVLKPESNRRTRTLTGEELQSILEALAARDPHAYRLTFFCAMTCCRAGEAFKLEWRDVDLANAEATFRDTKNGTSRTIPLSPALVDMLNGMNPKTGLVFLGAMGETYAQAPRSFRAVVDDLGLNKGRGKRDKVVFHSLRHTGATRLGQLNTPLRDMMDLAGWKTPAMALRYQHSGDAGRRRAMAALESMTQVEAPKVVELYGNGKK